MIVAIVRFNLRPGTGSSEAAEIYERSAPMYRGLPGLVRKYYLFEEGRGGGVYLWESRKAAERFYSPEWRRMIAERYEGEPDIQFLQCPLIIDNAAVDAEAAA